MMRALQLDFLQATRPPRWLGHALLGAGILAGLMVAGEYWRLSDEHAQLETQRIEMSKLLRREKPRLQQPMGDPNLVAKELDHARLILTELSRPWDQMFTELEGAASAHVALLGVQPSSSGDTIRLRGEARNYEDLLAYIERLENTARLGQVLLVSHEEQQSGGIRFSLVARWAHTS